MQRLTIEVFGVVLAAGLGLAAGVATATEQPSVVLTPAEKITFPGGRNESRKADFSADSGSPLHWVGDTLCVINSWEQPWVGKGPDLSHLRRGAPSRMDPKIEKL